MIKYILISILSLLVVSLNGQSFKYKKKVKKYVYKNSSGKLEMDKAFDEVFYRNGMFIIKNESKWGLFRRSGSFVLEPEYENIKGTDDGNFIINKDGRFGVVDETGNTILEPIFQRIDFYSQHDNLVQKNNKWWTLRNNKLIEVEDIYAYRNPDEKPVWKECVGETEGCSERKMLEAMYSKIQYPPLARERNIDGEVLTKVIINENGNVEGFEYLQKIGGGCDEEAKRVIMDNLNNWIPGKVNGEPVKTVMFIPVRFKLV